MIHTQLQPISKIMKTKNQIAHIMGRTKSTISRWMTDGCPYELDATDTRKVRPMFNVEEVRAWLKDRAARKEVK